MSLGNETTMLVTPAYGNGGGMFNGNNNDWWILLLFLFGGWGRGWGSNGGSCGAQSTCATTADVYGAVDQQTLISKLDRQTYGLADATYALNNAITGGFASAELSRCNGQAALMQQLNNMQHSADKCCCETQRSIDRVGYELASGFGAIQTAMCGNTRDIIDNANGNTRAILDALTASKIEAKNERIAEQQQQIFALQLAASQSAQNQYLVNQLRPCPVPAYITCNPFTAAGYGYGYGGGCGCGCAA
ncbi:MAG: hypothetical protein J6K32_01855 [Clostridia bacterium]|nr:hypothetical protein [Clostridia bacterium]